MRKLTKTGFEEFRTCAKSFWLRHNRPEAISWPGPSAMDRTRLRDGQQVERLGHEFMKTAFPGRRCTSQVTYECETLLARADFVLEAGKREIDLVEVKASTKVKEAGGCDHITDAAFQLLVAEQAGQRVNQVFLVHLNSAYRRAGPLEVSRLFLVADITPEVRVRADTLADEVSEAVSLLTSAHIDEQGCDCRFAGANSRCPGFAYFNPDLPADSAHHLPRISSRKLRRWENDFSLHAIDRGELSTVQALVQRACVDGPVIDANAIATFLKSATYPIHFYDYETTGPAVPPAEGYCSYQALPVQFSLHRLSADGTLEHFEWLADNHGQQLDLIEALEACVEPAGSLMAWHKGFENGCNRRLAELYPHKAAFLQALCDRTIDLEEPFKRHYVHWGFRGSTSIKKVLPVLCPDLSYPTSEVHDGTGAVEAWNRMIEMNDVGERDDLRRQLLAYCRLDSLAMVQIHSCLERQAQ